MTNTKEAIYKKAFVEFNEVLKRLNKQELSKIPSQVIENIQTQMDKEYKWEYDDSKALENQDFLVETKALIVEIYERYLCEEDRKDFWKKYDELALKKIEEDKRGKYNTEELFKDKKIIYNNIKENNIEKSLITSNNISWYKKIYSFFNKIFKKVLLKNKEK